MPASNSPYVWAVNRNGGIPALTSGGIRVPRMAELALLVFVASVPFETAWQAGSMEDPLFSLSRITAAVAALAFIPRLPAAIGAAARPFLWYVTYLAAAVVSLACNAGTAGAWVQILTTVQLLIIAWIIQELCITRSTFGRVLGVLRLSIGGLALLQTLGVMTEISGAVGEVRTAASGVDPNTTGAIFAIGFIAHAWNITGVHTTRTERLVSALLLIPTGISLARTGSRGALVSLAAGLVALLIARGTGGGRTLRYCKTAVVVGVAAMAVMMSSSTVMRLRSAVGDRHYGQRDELWLTSVGMVMDRPILGWGPYSNYYELGARMGEAFLDTHNTALLVFTQAGIVGGVPYLIGFGFSVVGALRSRRDSVYGIALPLLVTLIVINQSLSWHNRKLHWIIVAVALSAGRVAAPLRGYRRILARRRSYVNCRPVGGRVPI